MMPNGFRLYSTDADPGGGSRPGVETPFDGCSVNSNGDIC